MKGTRCFCSSLETRVVILFLKKITFLTIHHNKCFGERHRNDPSSLDISTLFRHKSNIYLTANGEHVMGMVLPMKCPKCEEENMPGANFCGHCGYSFSNNVTSQQTPNLSAPNLATKEEQPIPMKRVRYRPPPRILSKHPREINKLMIVGIVVAVLVVAVLLFYS